MHSLYMTGTKPQQSACKQGRSACKVFAFMARLTMRLKISIWAAPAAIHIASHSWRGEGMPEAVHCSRVLHASLTSDAHLHGNENLRAAPVAC